VTGAILLVGAVAVIDRIEGPVAVLEWSELGITEVPVEVLPPGAGEGDRLLLRARTLPRPSFAVDPGRRPRGAARARGVARNEPVDRQEN
jgi:hypothetical protein